MEDKLLKAKERLLVVLLVFLIILIPVSVYFQKDYPLVYIDNLNIVATNDSSDNILFTIENIVETNLDCIIYIRFFSNEKMLRQDTIEVGGLQPGQKKDINLMVKFPEGNNVLRINPECLPESEKP